MSKSLELLKRFYAHSISETTISIEFFESISLKTYETTLFSSSFQVSETALCF